MINCIGRFFGVKSFYRLFKCQHYIMFNFSETFAKQMLFVFTSLYTLPVILFFIAVILSFWLFYFLLFITVFLCWTVILSKLLHYFIIKVTLYLLLVIFVCRNKLTSLDNLYYTAAAAAFDTIDHFVPTRLSTFIGLSDTTLN